MKKAVKKVLFVGFLTIIFSFVVIFGVHGSMRENSNGQMQNCPFMGTESICTMNASDHINAWEQLFAVTLQSKTIKIFFLLALIFVVFSTSSSLLRPLQFQTLEKNTGPPGPPFLIKAFGRGILRKRE